MIQNLFYSKSTDSYYDLDKASEFLFGVKNERFAFPFKIQHGTPYVAIVGISGTDSNGYVLITESLEIDKIRRWCDARVIQ